MSCCRLTSNSTCYQLDLAKWWDSPPGPGGERCRCDTFGGEVESTNSCFIVTVVIQGLAIHHHIWTLDSVGGWVRRADFNITYKKDMEWLAGCHSANCNVEVSILLKGTLTCRTQEPRTEPITFVSLTCHSCSLLFIFLALNIRVLYLGHFLQQWELSSWSIDEYSWSSCCQKSSLPASTNSPSQPLVWDLDPRLHTCARQGTLLQCTHVVQ